MAFEWLVLALVRVPDGAIPCGATEVQNGASYTLERVDAGKGDPRTLHFQERSGAPAPSTAASGGSNPTIDFVVTRTPGLTDVIEVASSGWSVAYEIQGDPRRPDTVLKDANGDGLVDEEVTYKWSGKPLAKAVVDPSLATLWRWPSWPSLYVDFAGKVEQTARVIPPAGANVVQHFTYDAKGRLTAAADPIGTTTLAYGDDDALVSWSDATSVIGTVKGAPGRPTSERTLFNGQPHKSKYAYDSDGRLVHAHLDDGVTRMDVTLSYACGAP